ncbi:peptide-methionine (S)-S-oxide reductase MsrA [Crenobacter cavernae]|uniref:Peptide methionine sulfoxide reductase MsrA n=1 Tax=Crenobacter cavernae TaxID=2290923 RepID=A0ABY0FAF6_9NEIS|nr:peptide-methionine (S)-S-oxide reductase MsrA [Crenobacter cavernae]RXZ42638.1 peptide-methionine (S)-S-oxide reductase [Crenobacter cavernae]
MSEFATLAGGCFWCLEAAFRRLAGVHSVVSGYTGGHVDKPSYRQVCGGDTGHAEAVRIEYDPAMIDYPTLLEVFFALHDPTTLDRQGHDVGSQYRSAIYYHDEAQRQAAQAAIDAIDAEKRFAGPVVTELTPATEFFPAEVEHQGYFDAHGYAPYCQAVIVPKIRKLDEHFADRLVRR